MEQDEVCELAGIVEVEFLDARPCFLRACRRPCHCVERHHVLAVAADVEAGATVSEGYDGAPRGEERDDVPAFHDHGAEEADGGAFDLSRRNLVGMTSVE